ncbi:hypothetical protein GGR52DRAFT_576781 [Hypoxylon sp. FL1284]|nr:hypothetical protein GGR52DRAFT_576781 [Hypoxylon sp. FL1284]
MDDDSIRSKKHANDIWFTKNQRVKLWKGNPGPHDWLWVYNRSEDDLDEFQERLITAVARDGIRLDFVPLTGPDHMENLKFKPTRCSLPHEIVSDIGRAADFIRKDGSLIRFTNGGDWEPVPIDKEEVSCMSNITAAWILRSRSLRPLTEKYDEASKALVEEISAEYMDRMKGVMRCRKLVNNAWVRYIPSLGRPPPISSTDIRSTIASCPDDQLFERLKDTVLHPEILVRFIRRERARAPIRRI